MSTISNLFVNVTMRAAGFGATSRIMSNQMLQVAGASDIAKQSLRETAGEAAGAAAMLDRATRSARGYFRAASGGAIGGISLARAIKAGAQQESAENARQRAAGNTGNLVGVTEAWKKLADVINKAFAAFGAAFNKASGLKDFLLLIAGAIQELTPYLQLAGTLFGTLVGWVLKLGLALAPVLVAVKLLSVGLSLLATVAIYSATVWITRLALMQTALGRSVLALLAKISLKTIAMFLYTKSIWAATAAMTALRAISGPAWLVIAAVVAVAAAAVWLFWKAIQATLWAMKELAKWLGFTGKAAHIDTSKLSQSREDMEAVRKEAEQMAASLATKVRTFGWSEQSKALDEYAQKLKQNKLLEESERLELLEKYRIQLRILAAKEKETAQQKEIVDSLKQLRVETDQMGMSEFEKKLDDFRRKPGVNSQQIREAEQLIYLQQRRKAFEEQQKKAAEQAADAAKKVADMEDKISLDVRRSTWSEQERALDEYAQALSQIKGLAQQEYRQRVSNYELQLKQIEAAKQSAEREKEAAEARKKWNSDMAQRAQAIRDQVASPLEKQQAKLLEIAKLLATGNLNPVDAMKAADEAHKSFAEGLADGAAEVSSPKALLKGTAEALLAENRAKNPIEKLTEIQKQQLKEAEAAKKAVETVAEWTKTAQDFIAQF